MGGGSEHETILLRRPLITAAVAASLVAIVTLGLTVAAQIDRDIKGDKARSERTDYPEVSGQCGDAWSVAALECVIKQAAANHEQKHAEADLEAQQDVASYTRGLLYVSIFAAAAGIGGFILLYANLIALEKQTIATREIGEKQSRAFVSACKMRLRFNAERHKTTGWGYDIAIYARNSGQTPAVNVEWYFDTFIVYGGGEPEKRFNKYPFWRREPAIPPNDHILLKDGFGWQRIVLKEFWRRWKLFSEAQDAEDQSASSPFVEFRGKILYDDVFGKCFESTFVFCIVMFYQEEVDEFEPSDRDSLVLYRQLEMRPDTSHITYPESDLQFIFSSDELPQEPNQNP